MQSSLIVTVRSLVMLVCLIVVPAVAVLGTGLRDRFQAVLWSDASSPINTPIALRAAAMNTTGHETDTARGPAPLFPGPAADPPPAQPFAAGDIQHAQALAPAESTGPAGWPSPPHSSAPAPYHSPADQPTSPATAPWGRAGPVPGLEARAAPTPSTPTPSGSSAPGVFVPPVPSPSDSGDRLIALQARLRQLGATYFVLETWGQRAELFRFQCKVALTDNPHYTRHFEATDADPLFAIERVLAEVTAWKQPAGR